MLANLAFFSIALPDSTLGVAWPSMRLSFGQPIGAAGLVPPFGVAATLVSTVVAGRLVSRIGIGRLLAAGTLLSAIALVVTATSTTFAQFLVSVVLGGLSGGAIDVTLNAYAARRFGPRRINLLHASYVVGAATSPLLVTIALQTGAGWRLPYALIAALQLALAVVFTLTARRWQPGTTAAHPDPAGDPESRSESRRGATRIWTLPAGLGLVAVVLQTGIESSVALWAYSYLTTGLGVADAVAGAAASGYWLMMFLGRVVLGSLAERHGPHRVLGFAAGGLAIGAALVLTGLSAAAVTGVLVIGLAAGPVYPLLILTTAERTSPRGIDRLVAAQAAASSLGAACLPAAVGLAMNDSTRLFAPVLAAACAAAVAVQYVIRRRGRPR